jgi:hypothetical protein
VPANGRDGLIARLDQVRNIGHNFGYGVGEDMDFNFARYTQRKDWTLDHPTFRTSRSTYVATPVTDGHIIVAPREHVASIHALPMAAQQDVWALVSEVRGRLRTGLVPDGGFSIGFLDGLTAAVPVPHTVVHVVPRRAGEDVELPECGEWIADEGVVG